jgi:putative pyoverdin transport system ATP-binding/permease protein
MEDRSDGAKTNVNSELFRLTHVNKWRTFKLIFLGLISGGCSFGFIAYYNFLIGELMSGKMTTIRWDYVLWFLTIVAVFIASRRILSKAVIDFSFEIFWKLRRDVLGLILKANYQQLQKYKTNIYASLANDVHDLSSAALGIIEFIKAGIIIFASFIYMGILSWKLALIVFVVSALGVLIYQFGMKFINQRLIRTRTLEDSFMKYFRDIIDGFKEIQIDPRKGKEIYEQQILRVAKESEQKSVDAFTRFLSFQITGQILFYMLIASILLVFSVLMDVSGIVVVNFMFVLFFLLQAIESLVLLLPSLSQARVSAQRMIQLKEDLIMEDFSNEISDERIELGDFKGLQVKNFNYAYSQGEEFKIGPISFELNKGELIFIYGGNGSGKTTFMNSLLGLFIPESGEISFNNQTLNQENYKKYRTLFSVVFSDFYLFDEFYGVRNTDKNQLQEYLELFEIENKVEIVNGNFSTIDLSTGQRKRLALISALMEEKPILVLDEWAADQDPDFRNKFYTQILPLIKQKGITVLAITHDDKYYNAADQLYKMEEGVLIHMGLTTNLK